MLRDLQVALAVDVSADVRGEVLGLREHPQRPAVVLDIPCDLFSVFCW